MKEISTVGVDDIPEPQSVPVTQVRKEKVAELA